MSVQNETRERIIDIFGTRRWTCFRSDRDLFFPVRTSSCLACFHEIPTRLEFRHAGMIILASTEIPAASPAVELELHRYAGSVSRMVHQGSVYYDAARSRFTHRMTMDYRLAEQMDDDELVYWLLYPSEILSQGSIGARMIHGGSNADIECYLNFHAV